MVKPPTTIDDILGLHPEIEIIAKVVTPDESIYRIRSDSGYLLMIQALSVESGQKPQPLVSNVYRLYLTPPLPELVPKWWQPSLLWKTCENLNRVNQVLTNDFSGLFQKQLESE